MCNKKLSVVGSVFLRTQSGRSGIFCQKCNKVCTSLDHDGTIKDANIYSYNMSVRRESLTLSVRILIIRSYYVYAQ